MAIGHYFAHLQTTERLCLSQSELLSLLAICFRFLLFPCRYLLIFSKFLCAEIVVRKVVVLLPFWGKNEVVVVALILVCRISVG